MEEESGKEGDNISEKQVTNQVDKLFDIINNLPINVRLKVTEKVKEKLLVQPTHLKGGGPCTETPTSSKEAILLALKLEQEDEEAVDDVDEVAAERESVELNNAGSSDAEKSSGEQKTPRRNPRRKASTESKRPLVIHLDWSDDQNNRELKEVTEKASNGKKKARGRPPVKQEELMCNKCGRLCQSKTILKAHMRIHTGERPFKCDQCDKAFTQKGMLAYHVRRHKGVKPNKCPYCPYASVSKIDLVRHLPKHTKESNYVCDACGKSFGTDLRLKRHFQNVHERSQVEICTVCDFTTHSREILKQHYSVKHTDEKKIECPICHRILNQKSNFILHLQRHAESNPVKSFLCHVCSKSFKTLSQLNFHLKFHGEKTFLCELCGHKFKTAAHLKRHEIIHTGLKPFVCELCSFACNVKGNLQKHKKSVHPFLEQGSSVSPPSEHQPDAEKLKKGVEITEEFLKSVNETKGYNLSLEDLKKVKETKPKPEKKRKRLPKDAFKAAMLAAEENANVVFPEEEPVLKNTVALMATSDNVLTQGPPDILSDAMQILTSFNPEGAQVVEESQVLKESGVDKSTIGVPLSDDAGKNVLIITVITDDTIAE